jgi:large subunit ribosomal protein L21
MYAVFETGGKQFRAEPGLRVRIPALAAEEGSTVTFDRVLMTGGDDRDPEVGTPTVDGAAVRAEVLAHGKDEKLIIFKRKRRKGYRKKQGHRQKFTEVRIDEIVT